MLALCRYVDALLANHGQLPTTHPLVVRAYECMLQWILAGQWIVGDQDCHLAVISSIAAGIHIIERVEEYEASVVPPKPQLEKRRWGGGAAGNAMISAVGAPLSLTKPSSSGAGKLFQVNSKYPGPIKILGQELKKDKESRKNRSASSSISGNVKASRPDLTAIQHAAEITMTVFSNQLSHFPVWTDDIGPSRMSTMWNDIAMNRTSLVNIKENADFASLDLHQRHLHHHLSSEAGNSMGPVRYFLLDRRIILGCCEVSQLPASHRDSGSFVDDRGPFVVVTMRDSSGRNSWKLRVSNEVNHNNIKKSARVEGECAGHHGTKGQNGHIDPAGAKDEEGDTIAYGQRLRVMAIEAADEAGIGLKQYVRATKSLTNLKVTVDQPETLRAESMPKSAFDEGELEVAPSSKQATQASG